MQGRRVLGYLLSFKNKGGAFRIPGRVLPAMSAAPMSTIRRRSPPPRGGGGGGGGREIDPSEKLFLQNLNFGEEDDGGGGGRSEYSGENPPDPLPSRPLRGARPPEKKLFLQNLDFGDDGGDGESPPDPLPNRPLRGAARAEHRRRSARLGIDDESDEFLHLGLDDEPEKKPGGLSRNGGDRRRSRMERGEEGGGGDFFSGQKHRSGSGRFGGGGGGFEFSGKRDAPRFGRDTKDRDGGAAAGKPRTSLYDALNLGGGGEEGGGLSGQKPRPGRFSGTFEFSGERDPPRFDRDSKIGEQLKDLKDGGGAAAGKPRTSLFDALNLGKSNDRDGAEGGGGEAASPPKLSSRIVGGEEEDPSAPPPEAEEIFTKMKESGLIPNAVAMLDGLCKDGLVQEAMKLFGSMREKGTIPEVVIYTAVVEGFCRAGRLDDATRIFRKMQGSGVVPNAFSYSVLIRGMCGGRRAGEALELCVEMAVAGHMPNPATFTGVVEAFCKGEEGGGAEAAAAAVERLKEKGLDVDGKAVREYMDKKGPFCPLVREAIFGKKRATMSTSF